MSRIRKRWALVLPLPVLHLCLCLTIAFGLLNSGASTHAGGWNWFALFLLDFPFSILLARIAINLNHEALVFTVGGTLWWLLISLVLAWIVCGIAWLFRRAFASSRASSRAA
jgi:hypothetical protein